MSEVAQLRAAEPGTGTDAGIGAEEVGRFLREQLDRLDLDGRSVCLVLPDATRTCPLPMLLRAVHAAVGHQVAPDLVSDAAFTEGVVRLAEELPV